MPNDTRTTTLSAADFDAFKEAVESPPAPAPGLVAAVADYRRRIASGELIVDDDDADLKETLTKNDSVD